MQDCREYLSNIGIKSDWLWALGEPKGLKSGTTQFSLVLDFFSFIGNKLIEYLTPNYKYSS